MSTFSVPNYLISSIVITYPIIYRKINLIRYLTKLSSRGWIPNPSVKLEKLLILRQFTKSKGFWPLNLSNIVRWVLCLSHRQVNQFRIQNSLPSINKMWLCVKLDPIIRLIYYTYYLPIILKSDPIIQLLFIILVPVTFLLLFWNQYYNFLGEHILFGLSAI